MRVAMGDNSGKCVLMMSKSSSRETRLNMFVRSMNNADREGVLFSDCGVMMCRSMESCIALMMKSIPPSMPTA